jgi:thymidylate kinase
MDPRWIRSIYSVALKPDAVFYLRLGIDQLLPRVVFSRGFDYWESGMDLYPGHDMFDSFCSYQAALLTEFDRLSAEFNFQMVDAAADARTVCAHLQRNILHLLERDSRKNFISRLYDDSTTAPQPADTGLYAVAAPVAAPSANGNGNGHHHHAAHPGR